MKKLYTVELTDAERTQLLLLVGSGNSSARRIRRALTLLLGEDGKAGREIAEALHIGSATVARTRQQFATEGVEAALSELIRPGAEWKLTPK